MSTRVPAEPGEPRAGAARPADPVVGTVLAGRYRIDAVLADGATGRVYRAVQAPLGRRVALKLMHPIATDGTAAADFAERFLREASMAGALQHPNVVTVHDFGALPDGRCFIVMELLEGTSLAGLLRAGPLPPMQALDLFTQIVRGLRHAHRAGLVHRDMKPANVMVVPGEDGQPVAKLLDFGLVRTTVGPADVAVAGMVAGEVADVAADLTQVGAFLGTPQYIAPEQARGEEAGPRADIYAVGVMLYRACCGRLPFDVEGAAAALYAHVHLPMPPMRDQAPDVDVPPLLEAIAAKCLAKRPEDRWADADALLAALLEARVTLGGAPPGDNAPIRVGEPGLPTDAAESSRPAGPDAPDADADGATLVEPSFLRGPPASVGGMEDGATLVEPSFLRGMFRRDEGAAVEEGDAAALSSPLRGEVPRSGGRGPAAEPHTHAERVAAARRSDGGGPAAEPHTHAAEPRSGGGGPAAEPRVPEKGAEALSSPVRGEVPRSDGGGPAAEPRSSGGRAAPESRSGSGGAPAVGISRWILAFAALAVSLLIALGIGLFGIITGGRPLDRTGAMASRDADPNAPADVGSSASPPEAPPGGVSPAAGATAPAPGSASTAAAPPTGAASPATTTAAGAGAASPPAAGAASPSATAAASPSPAGAASPATSTAGRNAALQPANGSAPSPTSASGGRAASSRPAAASPTSDTTHAAGSSGASRTVVADGVPFDPAEAAAALKLLNSGSKEDLLATGMAPRQVAIVLEKRPFADVVAFADTPFIGEKSVTAVRDAARAHR